MILEKLRVYMQKGEITVLSTTIYKNLPKQQKHFNKQFETVKLLEENL